MLAETLRNSGIMLVTGYGRPLQTEDQKKAYFRIANEVSYPTLAELLIGLDDSYQKPRLVWFKDSGIKIREARNLTHEERRDYYQVLISQQAKYSHLVVELSSNPSNPDLTDMLDFQKVNGSWVLTNFYVRRQNFRFYHFNAARGYYGKVMLGVYEPNETAIPSKPKNPLKSIYYWLAGRSMCLAALKSSPFAKHIKGGQGEVPYGA